MIQLRLRAAALFLPLLLLLLPLSCAKSPGGTDNGSGTGPQLLISMTVKGRIRPDYFYYVLFNNAGDTSGANGPIPVVTAPYGNGFASGAFTQYLEYNQSQPNAGYEMYAVVPNTGLRQSQPLGAPLQFTPVQTGGSTIQFRIPISQLATTAIPAGSIKNLQINFITTNVVPTDPNYTGTKLFDALGNSTEIGSINNYLTIPTTQARIFNNSTSVTPEPAGDVAESGNGTFQSVNEPDLDIVDYSIEVRD